MRSLMALLALASVAIACGSTTEDRGSTTEDRGSTTEDGGVTAEQDLFACRPSADCVQDFGHSYGFPTEEALRCGGEIVASGEPGTVLATYQPGPYPTEIEILYVLTGDGKLFRQKRTRCMREGECGGAYGTAWSRAEIEHCDVELDPADIAGCSDPQGVCEWSAGGINCMSVDETWTCQELL